MFFLPVIAAVVGVKVAETADDVGETANVASTEMPRFNDNMEAMISMADEKADDLNRNIQETKEVVDKRAEEMTQIGSDFVEQVRDMNQTAAELTDVAEAKASQLLATLEKGEQDLETATEAMETLSEEISQFLEQITGPLTLFLTFLPPLQCALGLLYFSRSLRNLGILSKPTAMERQILKEIRNGTAMLRDMGERMQEQNAPFIVQNITKSSTVYNESTKTMTVYFFYSESNTIVNQLRGLGYFAYDTLTELFDHVHMWNAVADELSKYVDKDPALSKFLKRKTIVHLLDHCPEAKVLSHMEFSAIYQSIEIDNHCRAKHLVTMESVKVRCSVELKNVTVYKLDAAEGGKAVLRLCNIGWNLSPPAPLPFLFGGSLADFKSSTGNPYNVCGTVRCVECKTIDKYPQEIKQVPPSKCLAWRKVTEETITNATATHEIIERTISNISDTVWFVKFKPVVGDITVRCDTNDAGVLDSPHTCTGLGKDTCTVGRQDGPYVAIRPCGGKAIFSVSCPRGYLAHDISGRLIFSDNNGGQYCHGYRRQTLTNYTITSPCIVGTTQPCTQTVPENTILVVGSIGSGKSTFLNALAGVYWKVTSDGRGGRYFVPNPDAVEKFPVGSCGSDVGFTPAAVATDITTFDGREVTVIDTVGYDDRRSCPSIYDNSNLTEVLERCKEISAVVVVLNFKNPGMTDRFIQSLACVPTASKTRIQKNVVLVVTNWTDADKDKHALTKYVKSIQRALGAEENDAIKVFWMDNRRFETCNTNAHHTVNSMSSFMDHVSGMPRLSCLQFKAMRVQYQVEESIMIELKKFFEPSKQDMENRSKFEMFLFERADRHPECMKEGTSPVCVAHKLFTLICNAIVKELPKTIQQILKEANLQSTPELLRPSARKMKEYIARGNVRFELNVDKSILWTCEFLPLADNNVTHKEIIEFVVSDLSKNHGKSLCDQVTTQFNIFVNTNLEKIQKFI